MADDRTTSERQQHEKNMYCFPIGIRDINLRILTSIDTSILSLYFGNNTTDLWNLKLYSNLGTPSTSNKEHSYESLLLLEQTRSKVLSKYVLDTSHTNIGISAINGIVCEDWDVERIKSELMVCCTAGISNHKVIKRLIIRFRTLETDSYEYEEFISNCVNNIKLTDDCRPLSILYYSISRSLPFTKLTKTIIKQRNFPLLKSIINIFHKSIIIHYITDYEIYKFVEPLINFSNLDIDNIIYKAVRLPRLDSLDLIKYLIEKFSLFRNDGSHIRKNLYKMHPSVFAMLIDQIETKKEIYSILLCDCVVVDNIKVYKLLLNRGVEITLPILKHIITNMNNNYMKYIRTILKYAPPCIIESNDWVNLVEKTIIYMGECESKPLYKLTRPPHDIRYYKPNKEQIKSWCVALDNRKGYNDNNYRLIADRLLGMYREYGVIFEYKQKEIDLYPSLGILNSVYSH